MVWGFKGNDLSPIENKGALRDWAAGEGSLASHRNRAIASDGDCRWVKADLPSKESCDMSTE
jgi:hypothetical protein